MPRRASLLSKTLRKMPFHKNKCEQKLQETEQKLEVASAELYQSRRQEIMDRKRIGELQTERDELQAKYEQLEIVVSKYASDIRQLRLLKENAEAKERNDIVMLKRRLRPVEEEPVMPEKDEVEEAREKGSAPPVEPRYPWTLKEPSAVIPHEPLAVAPPTRYICSLRIAAVPLILLLSCLTRFLQRGPIYPDFLDPFARPVLAPGSVMQLMLFNLIAVTLLGEYARYHVEKWRNAGNQDHRNAELGAAFAHWGFLQTVCEEASKVLFVASMAFALLLFELRLVFHV